MKGNKKNLLQVLFILEKDESMDFSLSTHADVEIKEITQTEINGGDAYEIHLKYLGKYLKEFENKPIKIPDSEFKKELINFGLVEKEEVDNKNEGQLLNEFIEFKNNMDNIKEENNKEDDGANKSNCIIGEMEFDKDEESRIINSFEEVKRNNYNDISLPKGHIDPGEDSQQAALREVLEETGLECQIVGDL